MMIMNFITQLIDLLVGFVRRNPLLTTTIVMLALFAPWVLKGVAAFVLYFLLAIFLFGLLLVAMLRWRIYKMQRQMNEQFQNQTHSQGYNNRQWQGSATQNEGEVKVYRTSETPEKRISSDVGDYVEFEETKNEK